MDPPDSVSKHRNALLRHPCMYMGVKQLCKWGLWANILTAYIFTVPIL
jgi:hypothetical protein